MTYSTTNTYSLKREILYFSNKLSRHLSKPDKKFTADMVYGTLASQSCLLTDIVDQLHEDSKKVNSVERLARHLSKGTPINLLKSYLAYIRKCVPNEPVIHIDDSDIVKPAGRKFEAIGLVRDGSKSTDTKTFMKRATMSQRPVFLQMTAILAVSFLRFILHRKSLLPLSMTLPSMP